ncbi:MAG: hypothetical protein CW691_07665 [Candidatus Bathyarchaeum sp.]|nr:MAG: hypothetical protein CW691_07665 [Candidatus Bathyarchaeum sp.]
MCVSNMNKITVSTLVLILSVSVVSISKIGVVKAEGVIFIREDGSVEGTDAIQREGDVYTFLEDIVVSGLGIEGIVIEKSDIVLDGAGFLFQGTNGGMGILGIIGILIENQNNVTIKNMKLQNFFETINLKNSSNNTICRNVITNNHKGIDVYGSFNTISENILTSNNGSIHNDYRSNYTVISGNNISNNNAYAISLSGDFNTISANILTNNNNTCIKISGSNNTIIGNNIASNERSIDISGIGDGNPVGNVISYNNFVYNEYQLSLTEANATVDDGYPSGGNYWSDYEGKDEYSGENQDESGSDGIGDTPYVIDEYNQDNYPLMTQLDITKIPEFPTWIILPILSAITLVTVIGKQKLKQNTSKGAV